jgi:hypothetical protein
MGLVAGISLIALALTAIVILAVDGDWHISPEHRDITQQLHDLDDDSQRVR